MFLTVIIPHYNNVALLGRCLRSLAAAALGDELQVVGVDDGSSAGQREQLDALISQLDGNDIQLVCNATNRGVSFSRNRGLLSAKGRFVWFVDADDEVDGELLRLWWPVLSKTPKEVEMRHLGPMVTPDARRGSMPADAVVEPTTLADLMKPRTHCLDHTTYWISRQFLRLNPEIRYREDCVILEDSIFLLQLLNKAKKIASAEGCTLYIRHDDTPSVTAGPWSREKSAAFMPSILTFFGFLSRFMFLYFRLPYILDLYHRYCYVYMRVLAGKGVPCGMYRKFFYNPVIRHDFFPRNLKEFLLKNLVIHSVISIVCRILRFSHK